MRIHKDSDSFRPTSSLLTFLYFRSLITFNILSISKVLVPKVLTVSFVRLVFLFRVHTTVYYGTIERVASEWFCSFLSVYI